MFQTIQNLFDYAKKKQQEKEAISERAKMLQEILTLETLTEDESKICKTIDYNLCPDCGEWEFYEGPSGGMSTNYLCGHCGSEFNHCAFFVAERIGRISIKGLNNVIPITPLIIRTWCKIDLFNPRSNMKNRDDAMVWCSNESSDDWCVNSYFFYFKEEADAMAFKLRWI